MTKKSAPDNNSDSSTWESAKTKLVDALEQWNDLDESLKQEDAQATAPDEKQRQRRHKLLKELESKIKELSE